MTTLMQDLRPGLTIEGLSGPIVTMRGDCIGGVRYDVADAKGNHVTGAWNKPVIIV